jgi:hypothetical protein
MSVHGFVSAQKTPTNVGSNNTAALLDRRAIDYLSRVMDQFHNSFDIYTDAGAAGNHFLVRPRMSSQDSLCQEGAEETVPPMIENWAVKEDCHSGLTCIRASFKSRMRGGVPNWGAWYFMNGVQRDQESLITLPNRCPTPKPVNSPTPEPAGQQLPTPQPNWGNYPDAGIDLTGATRLTFWARGKQGGEHVEFFALGVGWNPDVTPPVKQLDPLTHEPFEHPDLSSKVVPEKGPVTILKPYWKQYTIKLRGKDLSYVLGGFGWAASGSENDGLITFYLDNIRYELDDSRSKKRLDEPRFLVSYEANDLPTSAGSAVRNVAYTYDNALALLAFLAVGENGRAKLLADALVYAQQNDRFYRNDNGLGRKLAGGLRNAYLGGDLRLWPGWLANGRANTVRMAGWFVDEPSDPPQFRPGDIKDPVYLVARLRNAGEPLDRLLRDQIDPGKWNQLIAHECAGPDGPEFREILAEALNGLFETTFSNKCLCDEPRFKGVILSPYLQSLVAAKPQRDELQRLNRLLLQAAYPKEIERIQTGWLEDEYNVSLDTGNVAWAMLALLAYYQTASPTPDPKYLEAAKQMGEWVARNCYGEPNESGFTGGFKRWEPSSHEDISPEPVTYKSTEHNIDLYAAFQQLNRLTGETIWCERAEHARKLVMQMWDEEEGKFWTGIHPRKDNKAGKENREVIPLDVQAWAVLSLKDEGALGLDKKKRALAYADKYMQLERGYDYSRRYSKQSGAYQDREGIWYEGTAQMAAAYKQLGDETKWQRLVGLLKAAQLESGGMPASDRERGLRTGFQLAGNECLRYYKRAHVGATAWLVLAERGINPYWMTRESSR